MAFLPMTLLVYFLIPGRFVNFRNIALLAASLIFYGWGEPKYILVMLVSIAANYVFAILIGKNRERGASTPARFFLAADIAFNLFLLGFFKYADFIVETVNYAAGSDIGLLRLALPIGISFYSFQTMSYVIDVYRGKVNCQRNIIVLSTYITLFPQLIAGPIVRYSDVERELTSRETDAAMITTGIRRFIIGLSKKILLANQFAILWEEIYGAMEAGSSLSAGEAWLGAAAFTFQIYFDFSGYSDMAIGLGKIFGFNYLENFNYPYISLSITEFWRRWHMSLSSWFKEYLYITLGGNKKGFFRQLINIAIVWTLTGLWHGASWNFVIWGMYYGILLIIEKIFLLRLLEKLPEKMRAFRLVYTMFFVVTGWVIFNISDFSMLKCYMGYMFAGNEGIGMAEYYLRTRTVLLMAALIASTPLPKRVCLIISSTMTGSRAEKVIDIAEAAVLMLLLILSVSFLVSGSYNPFLYFRF